MIFTKKSERGIQERETKIAYLSRTIREKEGLLSQISSLI